MDSTTAVMLERGYRQLDTARACRRLIGMISQVGTASPASIQPALQRIDADFEGQLPPVMAQAKAVLTDALVRHPHLMTQESCHAVHRQLDGAVPGFRHALQELMALPMSMPADDDSDNQPAPGSH